MQGIYSMAAHSAPVYSFSIGRIIRFEGREREAIQCITRTDYQSAALCEGFNNVPFWIMYMTTQLYTSLVFSIGIALYGKLLLQPIAHKLPFYISPNREPEPFLCYVLYLYFERNSHFMEIVRHANILVKNTNKSKQSYTCNYLLPVPNQVFELRNLASDLYYAKTQKKLLISAFALVLIANSN